jgi:tripartite motif-containing protein 71
MRERAFTNTRLQGRRGQSVLLMRVQKGEGLCVYMRQWAYDEYMCMGMNMYVCTHAGRNEEIYVADSGNNRVQVLSKDGTFIRTFGILGVGPGEFDEPDAIAIDVVRGHVAVAEFGNTRVQILDEVGSPLHIIKNFDWYKDAVLEHHRTVIVDQSGTIEELGLPAALAYTASGLLFITDIFYHRVLVFNTEWQAVQKYGAGGGWGAVDPWVEPYASLLRGKRPLGKEKYAPFGGQGDKEFNCPRGVAVGSCGRILVADSNNHRVQVFLS